MKRKHLKNIQAVSEYTVYIISARYQYISVRFVVAILAGCKIKVPNINILNFVGKTCIVTKII